MRDTKRGFSCLDRDKADKATKRQPASSVSFGVGRSQMEKLHIDKIICDTERHAEPGPDKYENKNFYNRRPGEIACTTRQYSIGIKLDHMKTKLKNARAIPGPG